MEELKVEIRSGLPNLVAQNVMVLISSYHHVESFSRNPSVRPNTWQELNYEAGLFMRKIKVRGKLGGGVGG